MNLLRWSHKQEHEQGSDAFGIADFARGDETGYLVAGNADQLDIVGILGHETSRHKVGSHAFMEEYLRRALIIGRGDPLVFVTSPFSATMLVLAVIAMGIVLTPAIRKKRDEAFQEES